MNEVKTPKKPLISYYCVVILLLLLFNMLVMPTISQRQVKEVDYNTFMEMTYNDNIGKVELQNNQILFTDKDNKQVYKTGLMSDPELTQRLYDHGAQFASEIQEQMSPVLSFLLSWVLPIVIFVGLGQMLTKQMMKKMGGPNSMMSPCPDRNSWRCSWAWALPRCATCSARPRRRPPASCSLTRSTPSAKSATAS